VFCFIQFSCPPPAILSIINLMLCSDAEAIVATRRGFVAGVVRAVLRSASRSFHARLPQKGVHCHVLLLPLLLRPPPIVATAAITALGTKSDTGPHLVPRC
jgi:hypothetical protein